MKTLIRIWNSHKLVRYIVWWGSAAIIDIVFLWFFTEYLHIYYLVSQILAFVFSFTYGFFFQKYYTFRDKSNSYTKQLMSFLVFQLLWLLIWLIVLKYSVQYFWLHYILWSIIAKWIVFIRNYIMNNYFNFSNQWWKK